MSARGSISIVAVTGTLLMCLFALAAADLGAMLHARARAQAAADAAALAAVVQQAPVLAQGDDPYEAAARMAADNGVTLVRCSCTVGDASATVEVETRARPVLLLGWGDRRIMASATATVDPDVFSYRDGG